MYKPLYKGLRQAKVDEFTACRVSVDLNPKRFVSREKLLAYQKKTEVAITALKSRTIQISKRYQDRTVAFLVDRDRQMNERFVQHQNETRHFLSGIDKRMAASDAHLKQHLIASEARLDKRMLQMDAHAAQREAHAAQREAQGRAENQQFLAEMDKREALRFAAQDKREAERRAEQDKREAERSAENRAAHQQLMAEMDKREALRCAEQDKRETERKAEQDKREAERNARLEKFVADMDKREALRLAEQDKRDAERKAEQDQRISEVKLFVSQQATGTNRMLLCVLIGSILSVLTPVSLYIGQAVLGAKTEKPAQTAPERKALTDPAGAASKEPSALPESDQTIADSPFTRRCSIRPHKGWDHLKL